MKDPLALVRPPLEPLQRGCPFVYEQLTAQQKAAVDEMVREVEVWVKIVLGMRGFGDDARLAGRRFLRDLEANLDEGHVGIIAHRAWAKIRHLLESSSTPPPSYDCPFAYERLTPEQRAVVDEMVGKVEAWVQKVLGKTMVGGLARIAGRMFLHKLEARLDEGHVGIIAHRSWAKVRHLFEQPTPL